MLPGHEFLDGERMARALWKDCLMDAVKAEAIGDLARRDYLLSEADRHSERADWYKSHYEHAKGMTQ